MGRHGRRVGVLAALLLGLAVHGCGDGAPGSGARPAVEWRTGETLPESFPPDVPVHPSARLVKAVAGKGMVVVWHSADGLRDLEAFYAGKLRENGWIVATTPGVPTGWMGDGGVTIVGARTGREVSVALGEGEGKTIITVIVRG
jgi:hypothetical protein